MVWLGGKQGGECGALTIGELGAIGRRVEGLLALLRGEVAETEHGVSHGLLAIRRHGSKALRGGTVLLTLRRGHAFQHLVAFEHPAALLWVHVVEAAKLVELVLLKLRRQIVEAGHVLQRALLIGERKIAVIIHPLLEMLLVFGGPIDDACAGPGRGIGRGATGGVRCGAALGALLRGTKRARSRRRRSPLSTSPHSSASLSAATAGERRRSGKQQSECRAETEP